MSQLTRCALPTCANTKPATQYLCPHHWRMVPVVQQRAVNSAYGAYKYFPMLETVRRLREAQAAALQSIAK
jgi:hypothetical protein